MSEQSESADSRHHRKALEIGQAHQALAASVGEARESSRKRAEEHFQNAVNIGAHLQAIKTERNTKDWGSWCEREEFALGMKKRQADRYRTLWKRKDRIQREIDANPGHCPHFNLEKWNSDQFWESQRASGDGSVATTRTSQRPSTFKDISRAFRDAGLQVFEVRSEAKLLGDPDREDDIPRVMRHPNLMLWLNGVSRGVFVKNPSDEVPRHREMTAEEQLFEEQCGDCHMVTTVEQVEGLIKAMFPE